MPSLARYIRGIRAVGLKEWWHQMQYIGDVKAGTFIGSDQCVSRYMVVCVSLNIGRTSNRFGNRYFENLNAEQEVPGTSTFRRARANPWNLISSFSSGRHRWVDFAQVGHGRELSSLEAR
jgi:NADH dehydrogenase (ubiquinone) 1 alpha subcomplex subunit 12